MQRMVAGVFRLGKHCFPNLDIKDLDGSDVGEHRIAGVFSTEKSGGERSLISVLSPATLAQSPESDDRACGYRKTLCCFSLQKRQRTNSFALDYFSMSF